MNLPERATDSDDEPESEADETPPSNAERFKLWRMDLATGLRTDDVIWKLLVPASIVFVLELILVRFWVQWWLYPSLLAGALLVGVGVYRGDQWLRQRRLRSLRQERGGETWEEIAVLVKTVDAEGMTCHMGFLAGRTYASTDRKELIDTLATRALERAYGYHPSPAIEERYAWCLDRYILNFAGWRENMEKPQVMDRLVNTVLAVRRDGLRPGSRRRVLRRTCPEHAGRTRVHHQRARRRARCHGCPRPDGDAAAGCGETPGQLLRTLPDPADARPLQPPGRRSGQIKSSVPTSGGCITLLEQLRKDREIASVAILVGELVPAYISESRLTIDQAAIFLNYLRTMWLI